MTTLAPYKAFPATPAKPNTLGRTKQTYEKNSLAQKLLQNLTITGEDSSHFQEFYEKQGKHQEFIDWRLENLVYLTVPTFIKSIGLEYQFNLRSRCLFNKPSTVR